MQDLTCWLMMSRLWQCCLKVPSVLSCPFRLLQVIPPALCTRNAPHSPTVAAQAHRWALQYRGYTVLQVPFHEWASVLDSGDSLVAAGYLQHLLDCVTSVRSPKTLPNF